MCELFGLSSKKEYRINESLREFFANYKNHPHGWGMYWQNNDETHLIRDTKPAGLSPKRDQIMSEDIIATTALAHIRHATIGQIELSNCHPFQKIDRSGRIWTLIHNGTIFDYDPLSLYYYKQTGETDSERVILYLTDQIGIAEKDGAVSDEQRFRLLDDLVTKLADKNKLNLLFTDGTFLYAHTNYPGSLHAWQVDDETVLFSTRALETGTWKELPLNTLTAYRSGVKVFTGQTHDHTYVDNQRDLDMIYQTYSGL